ncbi:MAG: hypothetical protein IT495_17010 [Gammaproteobacteria bacterium]|nr:hypothetical protein [Gammaproteobacteria bacterium]
MLVAAIIARLRTEVSALRDVTGAADLRAAGITLKRWPAAWVVLTGEQAQANQLATAVSQRVVATVGVVLGARDVSDATGTAAREALEPVRGAVRAALLGWAPDAEYEPCVLRGGRLLAFGDAVLWWLDEFDTAYYARA